MSSLNRKITKIFLRLMKSADVSNPTKAWPEYSEWINRISEEWYLQGDREKALGLPVSPFCNRDGPNANNPSSSQSGFINFIVSPLFDTLAAWTDIEEIKHGLELNKARWTVTAINQSSNPNESSPISIRRDSNIFNISKVIRARKMSTPIIHRSSPLSLKINNSVHENVPGPKSAALSSSSPNTPPQTARRKSMSWIEEKE
jgi:hypothetical protein